MRSPVSTSSAPRAWRTVTLLSAMAALSTASLGSRCGPDRPQDALVAGAAAQVAGQPLADLRRRWGSGCRAGTRSPTSTNPGVQKPHCRPCSSRKAACTGDSAPSGPPTPSIVVTSAPSAWTANTRQERTASPSSSTVHAPHTPCSHPRWVPVRWHRSRMKSASVSRGSTAPGEPSR